MSEELVTCAFTTFNASDTIERALLSAINQTYKQIEIIVVDDFSSDKTVEIIKRISREKKFPIKIIKLKKNQGVGNARNICIENANGKFICFFDDDDYSYSSRISNQLITLRKYEYFKSLESSSNISALCYSDRIIHYKSKKSIVCFSMIVKEIERYKNQFINSMLYAESFPSVGRPGSTATCTLFARKSVLIKLSMFNKELRRCEDSDLAIRALMNNIELISTEQILIDQYYVHKSNKNNPYFYELKLLNLHKKWLDNFGLYNFSKAFIKLKYSFLSYDFLSFFYQFFYLILRYPIRTISRLISSSKTIVFSISHRLKY
tara:strand:+ start:495 stop:1454 length:960 start_codon:yes stop_codon:yes gene_type:complete